VGQMARAGKIYLRDGDGLIPLEETVYQAEDVLQKLLADYPDLLAGDQMQPSEPRRWLLITREAGIADSEGGLARWSLDHLFLDQDATPTLVEVKRSTNTQIRREVVGQMLDYAANVAAYWGPGKIRQLFEERCQQDGVDADAALAAFLQSDASSEVSPIGSSLDAADKYWERAADSLAARRLRLVFVADLIPPELERIIEFLNESMARTEVLGVEVRQFVGAGRQTLVPRVIGQTVAAKDAKQPGSGASRVVRTWTVDEFLEAASVDGGPSARAFVEEVLSWAQAKGLLTTLGKGKYGPLWIRVELPSRETVAVAAISTGGHTQVSFVDVARRPPFDGVEARLEWCRRLNEVPGVAIDDGYAIRASWPTVKLSGLADEEARRQFLDAVGWAAGQLQLHEAGA
jgi:hypothetical protein